jgi:hypothetical protein
MLNSLNSYKECIKSLLQMPKEGKIQGNYIYISLSNLLIYQSE